MISIIRSIFCLSGLTRKTKIAIYVLAGVVVGLFLLAARVGNALSYLSNAPETCMNCHVMTDAYATWQRGSHSRAAVCIDCHLPHTNPVAKLAFKGKDGIKHSSVFLLRKEPQVLELSKMAVPVVQENCLRCHGEQFMMIRLAETSERKCWDCHTNMHGKVHSLSASPEVLRPTMPDAGLDWIKKGNENE